MKLTIGSVAVVVAMAAGTFGCSIHTQAPIKEIAYDYSDRDFYDRAYAPSPEYSEQAPVAVADHTEDAGANPCGCGRVQVQHYHHHDHYDGDAPAPSRGHTRPRPRAEVEVERHDETAEDTRRAERPTRSRPAVHVDEAQADAAPAHRSGRPSIMRGEEAPTAHRPASPPVITAPPAASHRADPH
jgi:hypothetical protein